MKLNKSQIRKEFLEKRQSLPPGERENRSLAICMQLFSNFDLAKKLVSIYLPIEKFHEINTYKILEMGLTLDVRFTIPKVENAGVELSHYHYDPKNQLELSKWGIPEPKEGKKTSIKDIDFILVPLVAFDSKGFRVGYGKGYYDQLLKKCGEHTTFIGLSYFEESVEITDKFVGDIPLHYCITPQRIIKFD
ncbi:MAG: 5-formyltetrahydrofolate cyclo-ligase [Bacteroidota bacterium]